MNDDFQFLQTAYNKLIEMAITYGFQVLGAVVILIVGFFLARFIGRMVRNLCARYGIDITLAKFFVGIAKVIVLAFALVIAMAKFGITIAPMVAAIGAGAFGLTLAIQGPISNYGAGLALILTRPFKVGNTLTLHGLTGIVEEIQLGATVLSTEDGERITIPNRKVLGEIFINSFEHKVVETTIGIAYSADCQRAIALIRQCLAAADSIAKEPPPQIGIAAFADSAISIGLRYWVKTSVYYQTQYKVNLAIHQSFQREGIQIPFPQREVRILNPASLPAASPRP